MNPGVDHEPHPPFLSRAAPFRHTARVQS